LFHKFGEFPKYADPEFPISESAMLYYKGGPPFMQRFAPFWIAILVERLLLFGLPILTIAVPLFKFVPLLHRWHARERLLHWYAQLKDIEGKLESGPTSDQLEVLFTRIDHIDGEVRSSAIPFGFSEQFYNLRVHIEFVRRRARSLGRQAAPSPAAGGEQRRWNPTLTRTLQHPIA
jgi:hypothetical protein